MVMEISVTKGRFGPLTKRYRNGQFREVSDGDNGKRGVICDMDRKHSGDYKVAYASDPLLLITVRDTDVTHSELRNRLEAIGAWKDELIPIEHPVTDADGNKTYAVGFKSLPRSSNQLSHYKRILGDAVDRDMDIREMPNAVSAYV